MREQYFTCPQSGLKRDSVTERAAEQSKARAVSGLAESARRSEISRICARYELESDEFYTAEQKALRYL